MNLEQNMCTVDQKRTILKVKNSSEAHLQENVEIIQNWVKTQPHIPEIPEAAVVEKFLLINEFNMEKVKKRISFYYVIRSIIPDVFLVHPKQPKILNCMKAFDYLVLRNLTPDLGRVIITRIKEDAAEDFDPLGFVAYTIFITEIRLREDYRLRDVYLYDMQNVKLAHLKKLSPLVINKISVILKKLYNDTDAYINIINVAPFANSFLVMLKSLYPIKVQQKIIIHENLESLYKIIPKENLPLEYGGYAGTAKEIKEMWDKKIEEYDSLFTHIRNLKIDQDLLPGNLKVDDYFGVHGNFKKLDVD